jgi:hypothetical protein
MRKQLIGSRPAQAQAEKIAEPAELDRWMRNQLLVGQDQQRRECIR